LEPHDAENVHVRGALGYGSRVSRLPRPGKEVSRLRKAAIALGALVLTAALAAPMLFADSTKSMTSGFQVGERTPPFDVVDVSGPNKGKQLCYV
jgi:hypothetical protein